MTEQLLLQQLESPSGTGRDEPRSDHQPDSPRQRSTGCQPADPILTGSMGAGLHHALQRRCGLTVRRSAGTANSGPMRSSSVRRS